MWSFERFSPLDSVGGLGADESQTVAGRNLAPLRRACSQPICATTLRLLELIWAFRGKFWSLGRSKHGA